ncbi:hypothetical protein S101447_03146 (plasmid) [Acetobacter ascendens]|uniref:Uncharacterized protein n=1 Tax=Acetobacter ascendens TaxID=481146 RepID=A0A1Y0V708_9PROT|nr:hypothetical protein S101447_03146 [Acetobacter ascendens]
MSGMDRTIRRTLSVTRVAILSSRARMVPGRRLQAGLAKGQSLQSGQQDIGSGREPQPELVGPDGVGRGPV